MHDRLVAGGLSAEQARTFLHLLADAEAGRFDRRQAHGLLLDANFGPGQAAVLIGDLLQRLATRLAGSGSWPRAWGSNLPATSRSRVKGPTSRGMERKGTLSLPRQRKTN